MLHKKKIMLMLIPKLNVAAARDANRIIRL